MERFVIREPRVGIDFPQGNQMIAFSTNGGVNSITPETIYFSGPYATEFNVPRANPGNVPNINPQMAHAQSFGPNCPVAGQGHASGIDTRYLAGYNDSAQFIMTGQHIQRKPAPGNATFAEGSFGHDYQNRSFTGIDRNKPRSFTPQSPQTASLELPKVVTIPKPHHMPVVGHGAKNVQNQGLPKPMPLQKKPNELNLLRNDIQNQIVTRADKLKALYKSGPRAFSGPVEKVLKWHKSLQDIGVLVLYEIVAKCVSVRPGESCSKNLVIRDDSGPAMQVVYYEIDFLLPELKPPCTVRIVGRMMPGTCRLQAFNVRPATGDDVAMLPRRAAVAAHHVAKLCKEFGSNV